MVKRIDFENPDLIDNETTRLTAAIAAAATSLSVENTEKYATDDWIIIGEAGQEQTEIARIATVTPSGTITITAGVAFAHAKLAKITKIYFDQMILQSSVDKVSYGTEDTQAITYSHPNQITTLIDADGTDDLFYRVKYVNTITSVEVINDVLSYVTEIGYITSQDLKRETGLQVSNELIERGIIYGANEIRRSLYTIKIYTTSSPNTRHFLIAQPRGPTNVVGNVQFTILEFADGNLDNQIDENDFNAYQEDTNGDRTSVTSDITNVDVNRHLIDFGTARPTGGETLVVEYYLTYRKFTEMVEELREMNKLHAVNYLFTHIPFDQLQMGISSWSLNGVTITFDSNAVAQTIESNKKRILEIKKMLARMYIRSTTIQIPRRPDLGYFKSTLRFN